MICLCLCRTLYNTIRLFSLHEAMLEAAQVDTAGAPQMTLSELHSDQLRAEVDAD